ncbi:MAG: hypothetical protein PHD05_00235 [Sphaerochaetaceae bacterium]|jgi:hypothetical protein|nr:hypothetical protein [Sphaerochaetaceae bacterium]
MELTDEQVKNWRKVLIAMYGAYALIMPESEIREIHKNMQEKVKGIKTK